MTLADRLQHGWWRRGFTALTLALLPLTGVYAGVTRVRQGLYRLGALRSRKLPVPVVVVGNLIVGGAGKTPTVIALTRELAAAGWTPGVISRGYGRSSDAIAPVDASSDPAEVGDEPLLIHLRTGLPVTVGRDRVSAAAALLARHPDVDVIVSDDGLQHLRLERDLQVLVFDERGAGNGWLLPSGPLRERLPSRLPARTLVLYNAAAPTTPLPGWPMQRALAGAVALDDWWQGRPPALAVLHALRDRPVWACAGMANPERFFAMLRAQGLTLHRVPLPDHHDYRSLPWPADAGDVLVTEKDAVKLPPHRAAGVRVWVVALDLRLPAAFTAAVHRALPLPRRHDR
ncbi:tetraacyldisaccharide 4'-kinase [Ideonella sp. BN130291]|uniref:tetraacyldisaccharide 4'-kinase n=1 Tax=Ideonella sp. BN130291 TaxID=3112940 RepID=UPI002E2760E5|nr:tetraacyldisaccharide 4'-kinase [Ideonella sp. BN130291]